MTDVFLNGRFIGTVDNITQFVEDIINERRKGGLSKNVSVNYIEGLDEVHIENLSGRLRRPLIVVKQGKPLLTEEHIEQLLKGKITWSDLVEQGVIEYLDAGEEENALVAFYEDEITEETTHLAIHPMDMFGLTTALVPYSNFSTTQKVNTGSKNQKQALGFYAENFLIRMDMDTNLLHTPQRPIVKSIMHDIMDYDSHPSGQNLVVAVMSYKGYNMEDAIVLNQGSIERGMGRSSYYRPLIAEELRYAGGLLDEICIPDKDVRGYKSEEDYRLLEEDGIIYPEAEVNEGEVVIGKTSPPRFLSNLGEYQLATTTRRESSEYLKHGEKGKVDFVVLTENEEGNKLVEVKIRDERIPEIGDKFTSRHGQKGVVGLIVPHEDMPFTASGLVPDLIFSPMGIPSRMTVSHLIEILAGKTGALAGRFVDGTVFDSEEQHDLREELKRLGFRENGTETMYDGITGRQFQVKIYIGEMYYLKLKHMVANKIHARARGPIQLLTRQPTEGRAKGGGLRLGEMEKDTFIAHGASLLLKERFDSDKTLVPVCQKCGMIGIHDAYRNRKYCPVCGDDGEIEFVEMSYAFKLLLDELKSLCVYPQLVLGDKY
ncbi:DNA-directed RNA polymerase subunit B [Candidatus Woesearchaeota archaeon]|nr:DNA-directed RNA polymerase subunit B [Candidatus Woesearchaeota archaeon]